LGRSSFFDQMKESNPGFDYRVKYDAFGRPKAVCWMLPEMCRDLLRFGNCLFLDSQKRLYNTVNWPYIGVLLSRIPKCKFVVPLRASVLKRAIACTYRSS
jgi:hypothetical protein